MDVVIVSYGPSRVTMAAVKRARRLGAGPVHVVAASETGVRRLDLPGVVRAGGLGTSALTSVLEGLDGPVLVAHDDVLVTPEAVAAMIDTLGRRGGVVVAHSNDVGTDHFVGTLPPGKQAAGRISEETRRVRATPISRFRPTAVLADQPDMVALVSSGIVDPRLTIADPGLRVTAARAVVAHDGTCTSRLLPPESPDGRPLLVASLIVKNEEETLQDCLASIAPLVDRIEVCDTGSTDRTVEIASAAGARVTTIPWEDDFGRARTEALERCRDAHYVLALDADERARCDDPVLLRRFLATYRHEYDALSSEVHNWGSPDGSVVSSVIRSVRIFRAERTRFIGALHEVLVADEAPDEPLVGGNLDLISFVHLGYQEEFVTGRDKKSRNLEIARAQYEGAANFKTTVEYARTLRLVGADPEEILELLGTIEDQLGDARPAGVAFFGAMKALALYELGRDEEALRVAREALDVASADDGAATVVAEAARRLDRPDALVEAAYHRRHTDSVRPLYVVEQNEYLFSNRLVWALAKTGDLESAYAEASWLLREAPESFTEWEALVDALVDVPEGVRALFRLVVSDRTGGWVRPALARLGGEQTAELCHAYLAEGGTAEQAVSAGLLGAAASGRGDLVDELYPYLGLVAEHQRMLLVSKLEARGYSIPAGVG